MDITSWLDRVGLGEYGAAFEENDIDADILRDLTDSDLRELGVSSLGHRKKLLAAIAALTGDDTEPDAEPSGERRQVTILFADLSGFTALSEDLGAEATHDLLNRFFANADAAVERYGGTVDKHIGDNVMAVFGAPRAHTDDPQRALRAALDIRDAMPEVGAAFGRTLDVHIGVASGEVVASGTGSETYSEYTVTGESVNLASRLQDLAGAGEILISDAVRRATGALCTAEPLDPVTVKGMARPVAVWRADRIGDTTEPAPSEAMVGRARELRLFEGLLRAAGEDGAGGAIHLRGEPGIGKTRLLREYRRMARDAGFWLAASACLDFGGGRTRGPIRTLVQTLLGIAGDADADEMAQAIADGDFDQTARLHLTDLLDLPFNDEMRALMETMDAATRDRTRRDTVLALIRTRAEQGPVCLMVEDLHWADPMLLDLVPTMVAETRAAPIVCAFTSRLDDLSLPAIDGLLAVDLGPLTEGDARKLAGGLAEDGAEFIDMAIVRCGGNPLFLQQLLEDRQAAGEDTLPATIQSVVQARLDRLATKDRAAMQAASALGQRFLLDAVRHLIDDAAYLFDVPLRHRLIVAEGKGFAFSHALIRDGAYNSLLKASRQALHRKAAEWFRGRDTEIRAEHLDRAEDRGAPSAYLAAGREQQENYRYDRAITLFRRGRAIAIEHDDVFALAMAEGEALQALGSPADAMDLYREVFSIAEAGKERCAAAIGIAASARLLGDQETGIEALVDAETALADDPDPLMRVQIHYYRGNFLFADGNSQQARDEQENALRYVEGANDPIWHVRVLSGLADALYAQGHMRTALEHFRRSIDLGRKCGYAAADLGNRFMCGVVGRYLHEADEAQRDVEIAIERARVVGDQRTLAYALNVAGGFAIENGHPDEATAPLAEALEICDALGNRRFRAYILMVDARRLLASGEKEAAWEQLAVALELDSATGLRFIGPRILGLRALAAPSEKEARKALDAGEAVLATNVNAHNHLWFRRDAIASCLTRRDPDAARHHADELEICGRREPVPWIDFHVRWARAIADALSGAGDRKTLEDLAAEAKKSHHALAVPLIDTALTETA